MNSEEKDSYIKNILQKDELISKKADDVFNEFLKGEMNNMKDVNDNVVKFNVTKDKKSIMRKRILATAASIMVIFFSANVYAVTKGYNNIFFMIKDMVVKNNEEITDKKEILSDSDLTISYDFIKIADGVNLQIKKLVTKGNDGELYIEIRRKKDDALLPNQYIVYDITNDDKKEIGKSESNFGKEIYQFDEEIKLNPITDNTKMLQLEVNDNNEKNIVVLNIDLTNKEIQIISNEANQSHLEKISEVELKKVLGKYANLNTYGDACNLYGDDYKSSIDGSVNDIINEIKIGVAINIYNDYYYNKYPNTQDIPQYKSSIIHQIIKEMLGEEIREPIIINNSMVYYNSENDEYELMGGDGFYDDKICMEISDIKFLNGIYTVTYIYTSCSEESLELHDEELPNEMVLLKTTMKIKLNENYEYTKYCVVDMDFENLNSEVITDYSPDNSNSEYENGNYATLPKDEEDYITSPNDELEKVYLTEVDSYNLSEMTVVYPIDWTIEDIEKNDTYSDMSAIVSGTISDDDEKYIADLEFTIYKSVIIDENKEEYYYIDKLLQDEPDFISGRNYLLKNGTEYWSSLTEAPQHDSDVIRRDIYLYFDYLDNGQKVCYRIDMTRVGNNIIALEEDIENIVIEFLDSLEILHTQFVMGSYSLSEMNISYPIDWEIEDVEMNSNYSDISAILRGTVSDDENSVANLEFTIYKSIMIGNDETKYIDELEKETGCKENVSLVVGEGPDEWTSMTKYSESGKNNVRQDIYLHFYILDDGQIICHRIDMTRTGDIKELRTDIENAVMSFLDDLEILNIPY